MIDETSLHGRIQSNLYSSLRDDMHNLMLKYKGVHVDEFKDRIEHILTEDEVTRDFIKGNVERLCLIKYTREANMDWFDFPDHLAPYIKSIRETYLIDTSKGTSLCSADINYEGDLIGMSFDTKGDPSEDTIDQIDTLLREIIADSSDSVAHFNSHAIDNLINNNDTSIVTYGGPIVMNAESLEEVYDEAREYIVENML